MDSVHLFDCFILFLLLGLFTRYAVIVALILQLIIYRSFSVFNYGYDYFLTMSLFYCFMFPVGKYYSIDLKLFKCNNLLQFNYQRVLQIHLSIAYFFSGIAKGLDLGWWNGDSMWSSIASVDNSFHSIPSFFLITGGITTVFIEFSYPLLVLKNTTRKYAVTAMIIMHTAIAIMMDLYAFSAIIIVWNIAAFSKITAKNKTIYVV